MSVCILPYVGNPALHLGMDVCFGWAKCLWMGRVWLFGTSRVG
jgi:hypothetical protein